MGDFEVDWSNSSTNQQGGGDAEFGKWDDWGQSPTTTTTTPTPSANTTSDFGGFGFDSSENTSSMKPKNTTEPSNFGFDDLQTNGSSKFDNEQQQPPEIPTSSAPSTVPDFGFGDEFSSQPPPIPSSSAPDTTPPADFGFGDEDHQPSTSTPTPIPPSNLTSDFGLNDFDTQQPPEVPTSSAPNSSTEFGFGNFDDQQPTSSPSAPTPEKSHDFGFGDDFEVAQQPTKTAPNSTPPSTSDFGFGGFDNQPATPNDEPSNFQAFETSFDPQPSSQTDSTLATTNPTSNFEFGDNSGFSDPPTTQTTNETFGFGEFNTEKEIPAPSTTENFGFESNFENPVSSTSSSSSSEFGFGGLDSQTPFSTTETPTTGLGSDETHTQQPSPPSDFGFDPPPSDQQSSQISPAESAHEFGFGALEDRPDLETSNGGIDSSNIDAPPPTGQNSDWGEFGSFPDASQPKVNDEIQKPGDNDTQQSTGGGDGDWGFGDPTTTSTGGTEEGWGGFDEDFGKSSESGDNFGEWGEFDETQSSHSDAQSFQPPPQQASATSTITLDPSYIALKIIGEQDNTVRSKAAIIFKEVFPHSGEKVAYQQHREQPLVALLKSQGQSENCKICKGSSLQSCRMCVLCGAMLPNASQWGKADASWGGSQTKKKFLKSIQLRVKEETHKTTPGVLQPQKGGPVLAPLKPGTPTTTKGSPTHNAGSSEKLSVPSKKEKRDRSPKMKQSKSTPVFSSGPSLTDSTGGDSPTVDSPTLVAAGSGSPSLSPAPDTFFAAWDSPSSSPSSNSPKVTTSPKSALDFFDSLAAIPVGEPPKKKTSPDSEMDFEFLNFESSTPISPSPVPKSSTTRTTDPSGLIPTPSLVGSGELNPVSGFSEEKGGGGGAVVQPLPPAVAIEELVKRLPDLSYMITSPLNKI